MLRRSPPGSGEYKVALRIHIHLGERERTNEKMSDVATSPVINRQIRTYLARSDRVSRQQIFAWRISNHEVVVALGKVHALLIRAIAFIRAAIEVN